MWIPMLQPMGAVNSNRYIQWELWIPIVTANGSCLMFIPMGYSQWELWIPMGTANCICEFQWLHPMGDVDNNGYSQWDL